jgi:hypothetical protein
MNPVGLYSIYYYQNLKIWHNGLEESLENSDFGEKCLENNTKTKFIEFIVGGPHLSLSRAACLMCLI